MTRDQTTGLLWDSNVRVDSIHWLGGNHANPSQDLREFLEDEPEEAGRLLGKRPPKDSQLFEEYFCDLGFNGKQGYIVRASTPYRKNKSAPYSWGHTTFAWFYFEEWNEEAVAAKLSHWAERVASKPVRKKAAK